MHDLPLFLRFVESNEIIKKIITNRDFSNINFKNLDFIKEWDNQYVFKNFLVGEVKFTSIRIIITPDNIAVSMLSTDIKYFDEPLTYFDREGIFYEKEPYLINGHELREFRRKIGSFTLFNMTAKLSLLKSALYGCIIKIGFYN
ncbi:hypothetical protein [Mucilaginibacter phyllosphaerae]|uniref:Uncharacterized protein n=1 Tax=Mucilaginibacter phyllosphaerae TaxID=1812349 RepID=A0A4Y8AHQ2_9SPHI|nr:hypothetical protein [Mucilaginibacter phyllosphaerae]MBB3971345.1 hypothetical protein [Mucilaginibacter phyllosphaerae]TEW68604.1 hypothetical protein E2R65_00095 [Mucilaginibacter phyllosphaerae]GGH24086.1 hypothetical protein GCM10007352_38380 [Mucilaginibacter phyllosphaerae]